MMPSCEDNVVEEEFVLEPSMPEKNLVVIIVNGTTLFNINKYILKSE